ncbi:MAG: hypothetical protein CFE44_28385, partial [Burkholderiales bacterium PBB4]
MRGGSLADSGLQMPVWPNANCRARIPVMKANASATAQRVEIVIYPGFKLLEAVARMSVFEYANVHLERQGRPRGYEVRFAAVQAGSVLSDLRIPLAATSSLADVAEAD